LRLNFGRSAVLFKAVHRCMGKESKRPGWKRRPLRKGGNFYTAYWCRGAGSRKDCQFTPSGRRGRDQRAVRLFTLFYDKTWPQVQGVGVNAVWIPDGRGWGGQLYFADGGGTRVVGSQFHLNLRRYSGPDSDPVDNVFVGASYDYKIAQTRIALPFSGDLRQEAKAYLASSTALRNRAVSRLRALEKKVLATLAANKIKTCTYGPYKGRGIPPVCHPRPLKPAETRRAGVDARSHFARQRGLLKKHHTKMYEALLKALPKRCWAF
jgi:hypothetical protein